MKRAPAELEHFVSAIDRTHIHIEILSDFHCNEISVGAERYFVLANGDIEFVSEEVTR